MFTLALRKISQAKNPKKLTRGSQSNPKSLNSRTSSSFVVKHVENRSFVNVVKRFYAGEFGSVTKLEGHAVLLKKLENPDFLRDHIANRPLPPGRDIWADNPRLEIRLPTDPLPYIWPEGKDFSDYDPVLKRNWEDELFALKWNGRARKPVQGGDWAGYRISNAVPPRIKIYYAHIVQHLQDGQLVSATKVFNALMTDFLAPIGAIPYGVFHTMLVIYMKRQNYQRALEMFEQIVSYHTPTPDDYALAMECHLVLDQPQIALEIWDALRLRPNLKPNGTAWQMLIRAHAALGDLNSAKMVYTEALKAAENENQTFVNNAISPRLDAQSFHQTILSVYAECGATSKLLELISTFSSQVPDSTLIAALRALNTIGLPEETIKHYQLWVKTPHSSLPYYNALLNAYALQKNLSKVTSVVQDMFDNRVEADVETYSTLIRNRVILNVSESPMAQKLVGIGLEMKNIRPSIRNYRAIQTALMYSNVGDLTSVQSTFDLVLSKRIQPDPPMLEALTAAFYEAGEIEQALDKWAHYVADLKLKPTRLSFSYFFRLAGKKQDPMSAALIWKLSQYLKVTPDLAFTSALVPALLPSRNHLGRLALRDQYQQWTKSPSSNTTLSKSESKEFIKFVDHILGLRTEAELKALEKKWQELEVRLEFKQVETLTRDSKAIQTPRSPMQIRTSRLRKFSHQNREREREREPSPEAPAHGIPVAPTGSAAETKVAIEEAATSGAEAAEQETPTA